MIKTILLDMDGVIADFVTAACDAHHKVLDPYPEGEYDLAKVFGMSLNDFWKPLDNESFWLWVPPYKGAQDLYYSLQKLAPKVIICSIPSRNPLAYAAKKAWVNNFIDPQAHIILMSSGMKHLLADRQTLLIDDCEKYLWEFAEHDGWAVPVPRPWNQWHQKGWSEKLIQNDVLRRVRNCTMMA